MKPTPCYFQTASRSPHETSNPDGVKNTVATHRVSFPVRKAT